MGNPEMQGQINNFEGVDNDELARRICDIDHSLNEYSDGEESNLKRGELRETLFRKLEERMGGDTAAATSLVEKVHSDDSYKEAA